jgi:hypothetical protein
MNRQSFSRVSRRVHDRRVHYLALPIKTVLAFRTCEVVSQRNLFLLASFVLLSLIPANDSHGVLGTNRSNVQILRFDSRAAIAGSIVLGPQ